MRITHTLQGIALLAALSSTSVLADGIRASLEMSQQSYKASDNVLVTVTLTNDANQPVKLLKWYTAADGVEESLFKVNADGLDRHYLGAHFKRPAPGKQDYIKLKSGESVSYQVELSSLYDMSSSGNYEISYDVSSLQLFSPNPGQQKKLARLGIEGIHSDPVSFYVEGREFKSGANKGKPGSGDGGTAPDGAAIPNRAIFWRDWTPPAPWRPTASNTSRATTTPQARCVMPPGLAVTTAAAGIASAVTSVP
ncbi:MAG: hypothetical protein Sw2LagPseu_18100 [Shewanella algae]